MKIIRFIDQNDQSQTAIVSDVGIELAKGQVPGKVVGTGEFISESDIKQYLPPVVPPNIIALALNYAAHVQEFDRDSAPDTPVLFMKATSSLNYHGGNIVRPGIAPAQIDFEAELGIVIGKEAFNIDADDAEEYIYGYTCVNDVTARDCQKHDMQWVRAKSFDTFCPVGPCIETELNPIGLEIRSTLNGYVMQESNTADMIFNAFEIVSFISKCMTLAPGTLILTGTPPGVGFARDPKIFMQPGDQIKVEIAGIGTLENMVI